MLKIFNSKAMTLVELLVGTILLGIIMVGVVAFSVTISRMESASTKSTLLAIRALPIMAQMRKDASLAVGNSGGGGFDEGVVAFNGFFYINGIAFRQDRAGTVADYTDDIWVIYLYDYRDANNKVLKVCKDFDENRAYLNGAFTTLPAVLVVNAINSTNCNAEATILSDSVTDASFVKVLNDEWDSTDPTSVRVYFTADITILYNDAQAQDDVTNPQYKIKTSFSTPLHSW